MIFSVDQQVLDGCTVGFHLLTVVCLVLVLKDYQRTITVINTRNSQHLGCLGRTILQSRMLLLALPGLRHGFALIVHEIRQQGD